jgi:hypothetical protein
MQAARKSQAGRQGIDLDEIAPDRFLVHNTRANATLKGEGDLSGRLFELTSWRREGLLARLRERGFSVRTLADRIAALPALPAPPSLGEPAWRPLSSPIEQFSMFDPPTLHWRPVEAESRAGQAGVMLQAGWVLRRRKGRGQPSFFVAFKERGGNIGLRALDETKAVLAGYAQALAHDPRPWLAERHQDAIALPDVELPPPHRELLRLLARDSGEGLVVDQQAWPLARALYERLGVWLTVE